MDQLIIGSTGYPGDNDTWRKVNEMTKHPTEALAAVVGNYSIVSGVVDNGTNISNGYITYDGELMPFIGGTSQPNVEVIELITDGFYDNNTTVAAPISKTRYARATANTTSVRLSDLKRITVQSQQAHVKDLATIGVSYFEPTQTANEVFYGSRVTSVTREIFNGNTVRYRITFPDSIRGLLLVKNSTPSQNRQQFIVSGIAFNTAYVYPLNTFGGQTYGFNFKLYTIGS